MPPETTGKTSLPNTIYKGTMFLIILLLIVLPLYSLFIGFEGQNGILLQIKDGISYTGQSSLSDANVVGRLILGLLSSVLIFFFVFAPFESLKSGLMFSLYHMMMGVKQLKSVNKDTDPEKYNNNRTKTIIYASVLVGIFIIYFFFISNVINNVAGGKMTFTLIAGTLGQGLVILGANTAAIMALAGIDPAPEYTNGDIVNSKEMTALEQEGKEQSNGAIGGIILLAVNGLSLGFASFINSEIQQTIKTSEINNFMENHQGTTGGGGFADPASTGAGTEVIKDTGFDDLFGGGSVEPIKVP